MTKRGYKQTPEHIAKRVKANKQHYKWQGDAVSVRGGRARALRQFEAQPCERCGASKAERHHRDGNTANNEPQNIQMLCRRCHMAEHPEVAAAASQRIAKVTEAAAAEKRARTTCKRGHPLSGDNLYINPQGKRVCKTCQNDSRRAYRARGGKG